jgi:urease accessory protein
MNSSYRLEGRLALDFIADQGHQTTLHVLAQQPPLKVIRAFEIADGASLVHLHNISGGILGGDRLDLTVRVRENARAQLTTTSATRIYRHVSHRPPSLQTNTITVDNGAILEMLPDPLIPFAASAYQQQTQIDLSENAGLFWWETVAPGREASGESFAYDSLTLSLLIRACGQPIALETLKIVPTAQPLSARVRLGHYRHFSTFYICRVGLPAAQWSALEQELMTLADTLSNADSLWGVSTLVAHGLVVRCLSMNSRDIASGLLTFWQVAKQALYHLTAIPPRKVY